MARPRKIITVNSTSWILKSKLHREDGPAVIYPNGTERWYKNGMLHRKDGPAITYPAGDWRAPHNAKFRWCLDGGVFSFNNWIEENKYISEEEKLLLKLQYG